MSLKFSENCITNLRMKTRRAQKTEVCQVRLTELEFFILEEVCKERHQNKSVLLRDLILREARNVGVDFDRLKRELKQGRLPL